MIAELKDYYQLLGLPREANGEQIRKAFRKLARVFHPDLALDKIQAEEKFKEINEAYEVLGDPENRRKYDLGEGRWRRFSGFGSRHVRTRSEKFRSRNRSENFRPYTERPEFRSFYEDYFGGGRGRSGDASGRSGGDTCGDYSNSRTQTRPGQRGNDIEGEIVIPLAEVLTGSIHSLSVMRNNPLTGEPERRPLHARIPAGIQAGQILRLAGRGDYGINGGPPGDLFLRVKFARHPHLRVRGTDLLLDLELTPWESLFGVRKTIPTLEGDVEVKVPAGTGSGQRLRLRGRGLPDPDGTRGDFYALVSVKVRLKDIVRKVFRRS